MSTSLGVRCLSPVRLVNDPLCFSKSFTILKRKCRPFKGYHGPLEAELTARKDFRFFHFGRLSAHGIADGCMQDNVDENEVEYDISEKAKLTCESSNMFPSTYYDSYGRLMLKCLTLPELEEWCGSIGEHPRKRARQLWRWMYYDKLWIQHIDDVPAGEVQNGFSRSFRDKIRDIATINGGLEVVEIRRASDGTRKIVFRLTAGPSAGGQIETVIIPITCEAGKKDRITLCVSSQVGCAMACQFCLTGKMGLLGNLTPGQISEQVVYARRLLFEEEPDVESKKRHITRLTNVVFMGMGEPLDNMNGVLPALEILQQPLGLHLSASKITVSTVGLVPQMKELVTASNVVMAVSLHSPNDEVRSSIIPVNRRYSLKELVSTMEDLFPVDQNHENYGQHVLIEYTMLEGINDSPNDAELLLHLLRMVRCKINLIVFNPHEGTRFKPSKPAAVAAFRDVLIQGGHVATIRASRGDDEMAACGQLGNPEQGRKRFSSN